MNRLGLTARSLRHYWRMHLGVLAGVVVGAAVLTGALLVGDSVDASLRGIALARLGNTAHALDTGKRYFDEALAERLSGALDRDLPAVLRLRGMALAEPPAVAERAQANRVTVLGVADDFWKLAQDGTEAPALQPGEAALNAHLAARLGVAAGDEISLRVELPERLSRDAPLSAREEDRTTRTRVTVAAVLPDAGLGRFSLATDQAAPTNVFVPREWLQERVGLPGEANVLLADTAVDVAKLDGALAAAWQPADVGLHLRNGQLESDGIFLDPPVAEAALALPGAEGTLAYLVNTLRKGERLTPYSFVVAGAAPGGNLDNDGIVINAWTAEQLGADAGDTLAVAYYVLRPDNSYEERSRDFTVRRVLSMESLADARALVPAFPGLADVENCADWDVGMPMDEALLEDEANEAYWDAYRETPKAFVTLAAGQALWSNRFGSLTAVRLDAGVTEADLKAALDPALVGLRFRPVREEALAAVSKAIDFGGLFLGMSFFLILSAFLLTGLLFVLGAQYRAGETGMLLAVGFTPGQARRQLLAEATVVALVGSIAGALAGCGYTWALIEGLTRYWQGAVASAPIVFHAAPASLATGAAASFLAAIVAVVLATRRQARRPARELLTLDFTAAAPGRERFPRLGLLLPLAGLTAACLAAGALVMLKGHSVVLPFFGVGSLVLVSGLGLCRHVLCRLGAGEGTARLTLPRLALGNLARRRARSLSVITLLASGCFLVFAVSTMKEDVTRDADKGWSGTGGYELFGEATLGLLEPPAERCAAIKVHDGDDASCLNLNHAMTPRLLGVNTGGMATTGAFTRMGKSSYLWSDLEAELPEGVIPGIAGDSDTAMWGLKAKMGMQDGDELTYLDDAGREFRVRLVGALPMRLSVFQGSVLIADRHFTERFPSEAGHRMFLIEAAPDEADALAKQLNREYEREGLEVIPSVERLSAFYTVERTYLGMFLVLGGLGVALGTVGMGVVTLRNLLERRGEIAMLTAVGYNTASIRRLLVTEHGVLAAAGLLLGVAAAGVAMVPALTSTASNVSLGLQAQLLGAIAACAAACIALALRFARPGRTLDGLRNE